MNNIIATHAVTNQDLFFFLTKIKAGKKFVNGCGVNSEWTKIVIVELLKAGYIDNAGKITEAGNIF